MRRLLGRIPMRKALIFAAFFLFALGLCSAVLRMESLRADGRTVLLELAPVDPRALLLGDYMELEYEIDRPIGNALLSQLYESGEDSDSGRDAVLGGAFLPRVGTAVIRLDRVNRARFVRLDDGSPLAKNELRLRFHVRGNAVSAGVGSYFFEEGFATEFERARYGEFRVAPDGKSLLVYLLDGDLQRIEPACRDAETQDGWND